MRSFSVGLVHEVCRFCFLFVSFGCLFFSLFFFILEILEISQEGESLGARTIPNLIVRCTCEQWLAIAFSPTCGSYAIRSVDCKHTIQQAGSARFRALCITIQAQTLVLTSRQAIRCVEASLIVRTLTPSTYW